MARGAWLVAPAGAEEVPGIAGEVAVTYGRNFDQELMVASIVGELKWSPERYLSLGGRVGGQLGAGLSDGRGRAFLGFPVLGKVEVFPTATRNRPFVGLGAGATFTRAGGAWISRDRAKGDGWYVSGPLPTLMPEIGVDLGSFRIAAQYQFLIGAWAAVSASYDTGGVGTTAATIGRESPGLNGASLQLGAHFGGPR